MTAPNGDDATTRDQTSSRFGEVPTTTSGLSVRGGPDDGQATDGKSGDSGDGDLTANRFGIDGEIPDSGDDLDRAADELEADAMAEAVARQWGTPEGEWWP